jgi:predicted transcriptional regulator YdeE
MKEVYLMNYEVVELNEKTVVGLTLRTSNKDENMTQAIGGLWQKFYQNGIYQAILNKQNNCSIGLYSNYENDVNGAYDVTVCCEVSKAENLPKEAEVKIIPQGKYAKFVVRGHMQTAVAEFWEKLWSMELSRKYSCDFEEYQGDGYMENCEIHMYISIC